MDKKLWFMFKSLATLLHMATCLREFSYCEMYDNIVKVCKNDRFQSWHKIV